MDVCERTFRHGVRGCGLKLNGQEALSLIVNSGGGWVCV